MARSVLLAYVQTTLLSKIIESKSMFKGCLEEPICSNMSCQVIL